MLVLVLVTVEMQWLISPEQSLRGVVRVDGLDFIVDTGESAHAVYRLEV